MMRISPTGALTSRDVMMGEGYRPLLDNDKSYPPEPGFSLLEIMIVCVLIGIVSSLTISNLAVTDDNIARAEARKFTKAMDYLREESAFSGKKMSLGFVNSTGEGSRHGYRFYSYQETWQEFEDDLLRYTPLPNGLRTSLSATDNDKGLIIVNPIGMISNFTVSFYGKKQRYDVSVNETLSVVVKASSLND